MRMANHLKKLKLHNKQNRRMRVSKDPKRIARGFKRCKCCDPKSRIMEMLLSEADKQSRSKKVVEAYLFAQEAYPLLSNAEGPLLHKAAREGQLELVKGLLDTGTDPNLRGVVEGTALHEAAVFGKTEVMRILITSGADINAKTSVGQTPLHWAADVGDYEAVSVLVAAGAQLDPKTIMGRTPLDFARLNGRASIMDLLQFSLTSWVPPNIMI